MNYKLLILMVVFVQGCASVPVSQTEPTIITNTTNQIIRETLQSTDWLMSMMLIGVVLGIFVGLNGLKSGWLAVAACVGGIWLKAAITSTWVFWACGVLFVATIFLALVSIFLRNTVVRDLIMSCQFLKNAVPDKNRVEEIFKATQSKDTQLVVNHAKAKLKVRGKLMDLIN